MVVGSLVQALSILFWLGFKIMVTYVKFRLRRVV